MALIAHRAHALLMQIAQFGVAIGRVGGVTRDATAGLGRVRLLPARKRSVKMLVKRCVGGRIGVTLEAVDVGQRHRGDGGLLRGVCGPAKGIARAKRERSQSPAQSFAGVAVNAAGDRLRRIAVRMRGSKIYRMRRSRLCAAHVVGFRLGMTAGAVGVAALKLHGPGNTANTRHHKGNQRCNQCQRRARKPALHCNVPMGKRSERCPKMGMTDGRPRLAFTMPEISATRP